jgi:hypothetical protein
MLGATSLFPPPVVVVYPLTVSGGTDAEAGANIAVLIANRLATLGGFTIKTYPPGTKRADFLTVALSLGADYYITGFLTPLGDQVTLVTQVVSTSSGSVISSSTALVRTYADATAQADLLGDSILHHAGRALAALDRPVNTPAPKVEEKADNIGGLFKRKKKSTPAPTAAPTTTPASGTARAPATVAVQPTSIPTAKPTAAPRTVAARSAPRPTPAPAPTQAPSQAPSPTAQPLAAPGTLARAKLAASALVLDAAGDAPPDAIGYAQDAIVSAFARTGATVAAVPVSAGDAVTRARELCASTFGARTVYAPTLSLDRNKNGEVTGVTLDIDAYDCAGSPAGRQTGRARVGGRGINGAVDNAATSAVTALLFASQQR